MTPPDGPDGADGDDGDDRTAAGEDPTDAVESIVERARERPAQLRGEDVATALEVGSANVATGVARSFLQSAGEEDADRVSETVETVAELLSNEDENRRGLAVALLADVAIDHPAVVADVAPALVERLDDESEEVREHALRALGNVSEGAPHATRDALDALPGFLEGPDEQSRLEAAVIAANVARVDADAVAALVPALLELVADEFAAAAPDPDPTTHTPPGLQEEIRRAREHERKRERHRDAARAEAGEAVALVAREEPDALVDALDAAVAVLADCQPDDAVRWVAEAVGAAAAERPDVGAAAIDPLADLLGGGGDDDLRATAAWALGMASEDHPDAVAAAVVPTLPDALGLLENDDPTVRARTVGLLAYVAEHAPRATAQATPALVVRLDDEEEAVRWGAATALGYAGTARALPALRTAADEDESDAVRSAAATAVTRLEERS